MIKDEPMDNTLRHLKELKVDARFEKKKHYNAASRKEGYHYSIGVVIIMLSVFTGTISMNDFLKEYHPSICSKFILASLPVILGILSGLQTFLNLQKQIEGHKSVADEYLSLLKDLKYYEALFYDKKLGDEEIAKEVRQMLIRFKQILKKASLLSTNKSDYDKAKSSIKQGEEEYTKEELEL